jgi:outer membrane lipoprotein-sorting protein
MKRLLQIILLLIPCLLCLGWADSWDTIRSNSGKLTSVQANFVQEKHLKILARPLLSKGIFVFQAPASLRWQYLEPVQSLLLMTDGKTRKFSQQDGKLVEDRSMSMDAMQIVSREISQWLAGRFNDSPSFTAQLQPGKMITLTPKEEGLAQLISRIELVLSDTPGLMQSVTIYEGEDSFTKIIFSNAVLNQDIAPAVFTKP